jgi:hypothetical protein
MGDRSYMLNEQLTCLTPFSQIDWPGLAWQTEEHEGNKKLTGGGKPHPYDYQEMYLM